MDALIQELVDEVAKEFDEHLKITDNSRILFSGKFGKGKTTFLTEFFTNQKKYCGGKKYDVYSLDPVNYTVATNEDIFKYIKYDIILHFIQKGKKFDAVDFSLMETASYYLSKHPEEAIKSILKYIPKVGIVIDELLPKVETLYQKIKKFSVEIEKSDAGKQAFEFLKEIETEPYSIYENDIVTGMIRQMLGSKEAGTENVLLIDNLDRIDPEHIFRILNVFSSQMDYSIDGTNTNKFFFDKVIIVCDINNIRNIYRNKYGADVDFTGYIDKFFSVDIFHLQNYAQLEKVCGHLLTNLKMDNSGYFKWTSLRHLPVSHGIFNILTTLVYQNLISLRQLESFCKTEVKVPDVNFGTRHASETPLVEMSVLTRIVGGYDQLDEILKRLQDFNVPPAGMKNLYTDLLFFYTSEIHNYELDGNAFRFRNPMGEELHVLFHKGDRGLPSQSFIHAISPSGHNIPRPVSTEDFYSVYRKVLKDFYLEKYIE